MNSILQGTTPSLAIKISTDDFLVTDVTSLAQLVVNVAGGGGLTYETGTYTPSEDIARPTINFTNSHTDTPILVMFADATGTDHTVTNSNYACIIANITVMVFVAFVAF